LIAFQCREIPPDIAEVPDIAIRVEKEESESAVGKFDHTIF
jgi:hypothetical protein